ncbi:hypothetical protein DSO57_1006635 [Entomophthora muscae]|uniref:Uncharacterized protein n=1 Tax=Entomophthora muscae TaxID=34485 RepID=A0ACC2U5T1_9FUNG|nr:hypothetical protein DSO57_1006635 [Entomophthora muscae]
MKGCLVLLGVAVAQKSGFLGRLLSGEEFSNIISHIKSYKDLVDLDNPDGLIDQFKTKPPFKVAKPTTFPPLSLDIMRQGLEWSYLSMCSKRDIFELRCLCDRDYSDTAFMYNDQFKAASAVIYVKALQQAVVSFKYTSKNRNWLTNFDFALAQMEGAPEGVMVHQGMLEYYLSLHKETMIALENLIKKKPVKNVMVTGYSLGGSIASISVPYFADFKRKNNDIPISVLSYAGTRVGNFKAKIYYESLGIPIYRYTNRNDLVPQLPPRYANYSHAGLEIHERATEKKGFTELVVCGQDYDEDPNCSWGEKGYSVKLHLEPFNNWLPMPPYCGYGSVTRNRLPEFATK